MISITDENFEALLEGFAILGTGGGGSRAEGRAILRNDLAKGRKVSIISPEDVPDAGIVASGGYMGSVKHAKPKNYEEIVQGWENFFELEEAIKLLGQTIGKKIQYLIPFEMGCGNTPVILSLGARLGIPVVDGDGVGRAAPETQMASFLGYGVSLTPMPLVDTRGNSIVVTHGVENTFADQVGRLMITMGDGSGANAHYPMTGAQLKKCVIPNTISKALELGLALQDAITKKEDPVEKVTGILGGKVICTDAIINIAEKEAGGFYFTNVKVGSHTELGIKNEAMALFVDNRPVTIFPDMIYMLDPETGKAVMSADLKVGTRISVVVAPCHPRLRSAALSGPGHVAFSPSRFGYPDLAYQPVEILLKQSGM